MLSKAQEKIILSLHTKRGRQKHGRCLVEGEKNIDAAGTFIDFTFTENDSSDFSTLITTETPQSIAAVARIPRHEVQRITASPTILVADGIQDPGNMGALLRLCEGFDAALLAIESCDITNPKVIRSSAGALFRVPWTVLSRGDAEEWLRTTDTPLFRLEKNDSSVSLSEVIHPEHSIWIAGSEGNGIQLPQSKGTSVHIAHNESLESLNVTHAVAIALYSRYTA